MTRHPENAPKLGRDRRLPRHPGEVGLLPPEAQAWLAELRRLAIADLGGEENLSALRREVLEIGLCLEAVGLMLAQEVAEKAARSRARGSVPSPSRYAATRLMQRFLEGGIRAYQAVGLKLNRREVTLRDYFPQSEAAP